MRDNIFFVFSAERNASISASVSKRRPDWFKFITARGGGDAQNYFRFNHQCDQEKYFFFLIKRRKRDSHDNTFRFIFRLFARTFLKFYFLIVLTNAFIVDCSSRIISLMICFGHCSRFPTWPPINQSHKLGSAAPDVIVPAYFVARSASLSFE